MTFYTGIDFGTSGARLAVIDARANLLADAAVRFGITSDWIFTWQESLWALLRQVPIELRQEMAAIALNGTSSTVLLCNAAGEPITTPLLYNDAAGAAAVETLRQFFDHKAEAETAGKDTVLSATSSLVKLLWWKQQPIFAQASYLLHQADWLGFLLHGQLGISDYHNSLKLGYDVQQLCYPDWIAELGVLPLLPRVLEPGWAIAPLKPAIAEQFGFPADCQVCAGTTDSIAAFLASGASLPGEAVTSLGSTLVLKLLSTTPVASGQYGIYSHRLGDLWLVGGASNTGGAVLQKFFTPAELETLSAQIAPEQESLLDYYPLIQPGERFPVNDPHLLPRLEPRPPSQVEFLHGILESMARIEARGYQRLQELGASPLQHVYTAGGGAKNSTWTAMRSRQLRLPVTSSTHTEAAYGSALLALRSR